MKNLRILLWGLSGVGKSSVAYEVSCALKILYVEGDNFHTDQAKSKMADGIAVDDQYRYKWIKKIIDDVSSKNGNFILACSAIRCKHRLLLIRELAINHSFELCAFSKTLTKRIETRKNHFFSKSLLDSQLKDLEEDSFSKKIMTENLTIEDVTKIVLELCD